MSKIKYSTAIKHVTETIIATTLFITVLVAGLAQGIKTGFNTSTIILTIITGPIVIILLTAAIFKLTTDAVHIGQQEKEKI